MTHTTTSLVLSSNGSLILGFFRAESPFIKVLVPFELLTSLMQI
jgi:hypothetical protein